MSTSTYNPDSWVPVLIESEEHGKIYKVLASWYGGFAGSDYWKLSSGIESISIETREDGHRVLTMPQASGSVYVVGEHTHMSSLMHAQYAHWSKRAEEAGTFTIKVLTVDELLEAFK